MAINNQANRIDLLSFRKPQMRAFHVTWAAFFLCFFGWFGVAPLMAVIRDDLGLTKEQIGNTIIGSVAITVFVRLLIGPLCDKYGPRIVYTWLLLLGSLPVMGIGLADSYESFLLFRVAIGAIGASFVVTQFHTTLMFAPNVVGTANAMTAGWGNLGGGVVQVVMPLIFAAFVWFGADAAAGWRYAMVVPGLVLMLAGVGYYYLTQDTPNGNFAELRAAGAMPALKPKTTLAGALEAARDVRVWSLAAIYAACFGIELTINNVAALYFRDTFGVGVAAAGLVAGLFGGVNIFARAFGGYLSDRTAARWGLQGRVRFLFLVVFAEAVALFAFSQMNVFAVAIAVMLVFSLFVQMACGATFGVVPFINRKAMGTVSGIVGAGGNVGAVAAGFLFRSESIGYQQAFAYLGVAVALLSFSALLVRFSPETIEQENASFREAASLLPGSTAS